MRVKMILPSLTEAKSPLFRPIKYSLFPPLGLATLAAFLDPDDENDLQDEHVERLNLDDDPELVVIQVYIAISVTKRLFLREGNPFTPNVSMKPSPKWNGSQGSTSTSSTTTSSETPALPKPSSTA